MPIEDAAMATLFPPWANTATTVVLGAVAGAIVGALAAPMIYARMPYATHQDDPVVQPIAFDHCHPVRDCGIGCLYCHERAERSAFAGVPPSERCLGCHNQLWNDSAMIAPLRASVDSGEPIRWQRVNSLPDFVYFDHSIHVARGIGCERCHGRI